MTDAATSRASAIGRLMRFGREGAAGRWLPVGEPLPPFSHAPPDPTAIVAPWVLPRELETRGGDVVVVGELAHQLVARCATDDPLYDDLVRQTQLFHTPEETTAWLAGVELWIGRRLGPDEPWPEPPAERT